MALSNPVAEQRLDWLKAQLETGDVMLIKAAADALEVSEMTIRRDLQELEALGLARRVRGGAVAVGPTAFADRHRRRGKAKSVVAAKLLPMVPSTGAIGLDASSTMLRLATAMSSARDLTVVTNGWDTFEALQDKPGIKPVLTGGELDPRTGSLVGPVAQRAAGSFLLSHFFASAACVDPVFGCSEAALEEAEVKQVLSRVCEQVILGADASKLGSRAVAVSFGWEDVACLATDLDPFSPRLADYQGKTRLL